MIKYEQFLFEASSEDFARTFNNNLTISFDSLLSLTDLTPEKSVPGSQEYESRRADSEKRKLSKKKEFYQKIANAPSLTKALNIAVFEATKYYNAIRTKLDPTREVRAQQKAAEIGKSISLPGLKYEPSPVPKEALDREPIAKFFLESIIVLKEIAEELERPGFEELNQQLFNSFKTYFSKVAKQDVSESMALNEKKEPGIKNYLAMFDDVKTVVQSYRSQIDKMLTTINSLLASADTDAPLTKYKGFADKLRSYNDWISDPSSFSLGDLDEQNQIQRITEIKKKVDEIGQFLDDATFKGGTYAKFIEDASKPVSLGLGQFDRMLGDSSRFISLGMEKMARLQSIVTNIWKSSRVFRGFGAGDAKSSIEAVAKGISGAKEEGLKSAIVKKIGSKKTGTEIPKLPKLQTPDAKNIKSADLKRALSPVTDFEKDMKRKAEDERAFTLSTRIIGNPEGLPNLRPLEQRFLKKGEDE